MMLSVPSKTFLMGEYTVLSGGPGLVINTTPRFTLEVTKAPPTDEQVYEGIHPDSPAGKMIDANPKLYRGFRFRFTDPHKGRGGFGASSAQFLMAYASRRVTKSKDIDYFKLLDLYEKYGWSGNGYAPSGVDMLGQFEGLIAYIGADREYTDYAPWSFDDIGFCLLHTGNKVATHEHLKNLPPFPDERLEELVDEGLVALTKNDQPRLVEAVQAYRQELEAANLTHEHTLALLKEIDKRPGVLAAKGCGALGADVILVILKKDVRTRFTKWAFSQNLATIARETDITCGIKLEGDSL